MGKRPVLRKTTETSLRAAEEVGDREVARGATTAIYQKRKHTLALTLRSGATIAIPIANLPGLTKATADQLADLTLTAVGTQILWPQLDVELSVIHIVRDATGANAAHPDADTRQAPATTGAPQVDAAEGGRMQKKAPAP